MLTSWTACCTFGATSPAGVEKVPKGKRVRSVPMMPAVIDALGSLKDRERFTAADDLVFTREGEHLNHFALRKRYYEALERAKLRRLRFHDLRHAFGSAAITKLDPHAVQSYMGHQHYSTTQRYLHHRPRRDDAAKLAERSAADADPGQGAGQEVVRLVRRLRPAFGRIWFVSATLPPVSGYLPPVTSWGLPPGWGPAFFP